jgi:hypothetical protein
MKILKPDSLDTQILYKKVLLPILAIEDLRWTNWERTDNLCKKKKNKIDQGEFEIGYYILQISEIKAFSRR